MVRFSDIIKIKDKTGSKPAAPQEPLEEPIKETPQEDKLWLSESQVFKVSDINNSFRLGCLLFALTAQILYFLPFTSSIKALVEGFT